MTARLAWTLSVLVVGCGDRKPDGAKAPWGAGANVVPGAGAPAVPEAPADPGASEPPAPSASSTGWTAKKRISHDVTVEGIAISLEVPEGLPRDDRTGDWNVSAADLVEVPKVVTSTIEVSRVENLERAKYHGTLSARTKTWVREEKREDGFALTTAEPDKTHIEAIRYLRAGEMFVRCKATQQTEAPIPDHARVRVMLEQICDSMTLR